ncbi:MAG: hydantoinase/oxoprolinase N-terminal domain-containing protein [Bdellovibrionota bacterium]
MHRLGLWVGDSFAEIRGKDFSRWFLPKKSLSEGIKEALRAIEDREVGGELVFASSRTESALERRQGSQPALFVTSGFESWARTARHSRRTGPVLSVERAWTPVPEDNVFGIDERISVDGKIEKPLKMEELEFLVGKLELLKVKDVALGFRHSSANPEHERQAAAYLREKGFRVSASHEMPSVGKSEAKAWTHASEAAYVESVVREDVESIRSALDAEGASSWKISAWTSRGLSNDPAAFTASGLRGGTSRAIGGGLSGGKESDRKTALIFGLEDFQIVDASTSVENAQSRTLAVQPTCQIATELWPFPVWTAVDRGFEPGPMLFGKSHQLTFLDVLFVQGRLTTAIDAFSDRIQEKSAPRILEALFTVGKHLAEPGRRIADAKTIAADLERAAIERIAIDLAVHPAKTKIALLGPLAPILAPLLAKRRPDLTFDVEAKTTFADLVLRSNGGPA